MLIYAMVDIKGIPIHGTHCRLKDDAVLLLKDRVANGEAFQGESVARMQSAHYAARTRIPEWRVLDALGALR